MALSPNYGWAEPDNSSLVKNGATDIRALGDAIDTSVWNVGYGQAGKNKVINGDFSVNQRAFTSTTTTSVFTFDRWLTTYAGGTSTYSAQTFTPGTAPVAGYESTNFARIASTGQSAASDNTRFRYRIEDVRTFAGQTVTLSFWAKAGSGTPSIAAYYTQVFGSGGSTAVTINGEKKALTTSWTRYTITLAIPSISGKTLGAGSYLEILFVTSAGTDFNDRTQSIGIQTATIDLWGVQAEYGSKATPFQTASGGSPQAELAMCQRYFERMVNGADNSSETIGVFQCFSTTQGYGTLRFVVPKRATPSMTFSGNADFVVKDASGTNRATTLMATGTYSPRTANVTFTIGTASLVAGSAAWMLANSATATIDVSAEL